MKSLLTKLLISFIVGIVYLLGHFYSRTFSPHIYNYLKEINNDTLIALQAFFLSIIPISIALWLKRKGKYKLVLSLAAFANIFSFQLFIHSLVFLTAPFVCTPVVFNLHFFVMHTTAFIIGVIVLYISASMVKKHTCWILLSFLGVYLFDVIVVQGWYIAWFYDYQV
ncbi:MAG: hypothetical protein C0595_02265 [Marinilabiliales bacterium]|nr:MAG: hypothetical protein C0595_02265 [Marinilabiliales bacterium]